MSHAAPHPLHWIFPACAGCVHSRARRLPALALLAALLSLPLAEATPPTSRRVSADGTPPRSVRVGTRRLPHVSPTWVRHGGSPLRVIRNLARTDPPAARTRLVELIESLQGGTLLPEIFDGDPESDVELPWRLPPAASVLRDFVQTLDEPWLDIATLLSFDDRWPTAPIYWHPNLATAAAEHFTRALERADWHRVELWLEAANTPTISAELSDWLRGARDGLETPGLESPQRSDRSNHTPYPIPHLRGPWQVRAIDPHAGPPRHRPENVQLLATEIGTRPVVANRIEPGVHDDLVVVNLGTAVVGFDRRPPYTQRFELRDGIPAVVTPDRLPLFAVPGPVIPEIGQLWAVAVGRGQPPAALELFGQLASKKPAPRSHSEWFARLDALAWNRLLVFGVEEGQVWPQPSPAALDDATIVARPIFTSDRLIVVVTRGWAEVEFEVVALDLRDLSVAWRRAIGIDIPGYSTIDCRESIRQATARLDEDGLLVTVDAGWTTRLALASGSILGTLVHETHETEFPQHNSAWRGTHGRQLHADLVGRHRYPGPTLTRPRGDGRRLAVELPPRAARLHAFEPATLTPVWRSDPVSDMTSLAGVHDDCAILIDLEPHDGVHFDLLRIELETGRLRSALRLPLGIEERGIEERGIEERIGPRTPFVVGAPFLRDRMLCLPTIRGVLSWPLTAPAWNPFVESWPDGVAGGEIFAIGPDRALVLRHPAPIPIRPHGATEPPFVPIQLLERGSGSTSATDSANER